MFFYIITLLTCDSEYIYANKKLRALSQTAQKSQKMSERYLKTIRRL